MRGIVPLTVAALMLGATTAWPEVHVTLDDSMVTAEGLTPGGTAIVFAVTRTRLGPMRQIHQIGFATEVDATGAIDVEMPEGIPQVSIWTVADLDAGEVGVGLPEGMQDTPLLDEDGRPMTVGQVASGRIVAGLAEADILVVRPGEGAWRLHVGDGGESDGDASPNGALQVLLQHMTPLTDTSGPLRSVRPGDSIVVIAPREMAYLVEHLGH
jgi:hypothetical protein